MRIHKRVRLSDLRAISSAEHTKARSICEQIQRIVSSRNDYVVQHKLDTEIAIPGANWSEDAENAIHSLYRLVVKCDYEVINRLRFYTQPFTGYELASLSLGHGKGIPIIPQEFDQEMEHLRPGPDLWIRRYAVISRRMPSDLIARFPKVLGEIGWEVNGHPVNHDVFSYQERLNLMFEAGIINWLRKRAEENGNVRILEIGGGYGGLAYALATALTGKIHYIICDIPESLLFSAVYLGITLPACRHSIYDGASSAALTGLFDQGFSYMPNHLFDELVESGTSIDLVINTLSMAEMTIKQVRYYAERVKSMMGDTGVFFEQNHDGRWLGLLNCKPLLAEAFTFGAPLSPKTIPALSKGETHLWSNRRLTEIVEPAMCPFGGLTKGIGLAMWRLYWLMRMPTWGISKLRQILQKIVSPRLFKIIRDCWNRLGGRLKS